MNSEKYNIIKKTEDIAVIAVCVANAAEIPFERNRKVLLEMYGDLLSECSQIMREDSGCLDVIMHNDSVFGVLDGSCDKLLFKSMFLAMQVHNLIRSINRKGDKQKKERLVSGIGIAFGKAEKISITERSYTQKSDVWLGAVLSRAHSMAQKAGLDGRNQILISE